MDPAPFSIFIKKRRQELGLSLKEAAQRTGIQPSRLHDLEQGRSSTTGKATDPTRENIKLLARGYQLPVALLSEVAGHPPLNAETVEEKRLLSHFRSLLPGHRAAALALVEHLYQMDCPSA